MSNINHPTHYNSPVPQFSRPVLQALGFTPKELDQTECIAAMEDAFGPTALYWFCIMSATKYLWRAGLKGDAQQDYAKARWYFCHAENLEGLGVPESDRKRVKAAERLVP